MIKAVIFDMDGLMIDSENISFMCYQKILDKYHLTLSRDLYMSFLGKTIENAFLIIEENFGLKLSIEDSLQEFKGIMEEIVEQQGVSLKKGLIDLLKYLKDNHYQTIIATSSGRPRVHQLLQDTHVLNYFDDIVCGDEVKKGKPNPDIFIKACEKLGVSPNETLVLEDSEAGIQAAYSAQIPVICIPDMKYPDPQYQSMTTQILESLDLVIPYLKKIKQI